MAWLAFVSALAFAAFWNWTSPTATTAKADGDAIRAGVEHYRTLHGVYPESLGSAGIRVPWTRYRGWGYEVRDHGTRFELTAGDYGEDGFIVRWNSKAGRWWEDT